MTIIIRTILAFLFVALTNTCFAFWISTPLEVLATKSDYVVIGEVKALVADLQSERVKVTLRVLDPIKGKMVAGEDLVFEAPFSLHPDFQTGEVWLHSFASNEVCAVFLKTAQRKVPWLLSKNLAHGTGAKIFSVNAELGQVPFQSTPIQMTKEDDGKLLVDWEKRAYQHGIMSDNAWKPLSELKVKLK